MGIRVAILQPETEVRKRKVTWISRTAVAHIQLPTQEREYRDKKIFFTQYPQLQL